MRLFVLSFFSSELFHLPGFSMRTKKPEFANLEVQFSKSAFVVRFHLCEDTSVLELHECIILERAAASAP